MKGAVGSALAAGTVTGGNEGTLRILPQMPQRVVSPRS